MARGRDAASDFASQVARLSAGWTATRDKPRQVARAKEVAELLFGQLPCGFLQHPAVRLTSAFVKSGNLYLDLQVQTGRPAQEVHESWICKVFPRERGQGSAAEVEAYRRLAVPAVQPFVIQRLASFECPDARRLLEGAPASAREACAEFAWEGRVTVLVLERSPGMTLSRWLKRGGGGAELEVLVAQAVFLLANLERLGVHHNDLHLANIFVERGPPVETVLRFGAQTLRLPPSELTLRVFDFDMALVAGTTNTLLRRVYTKGWCREMGMCRSRNGRDLAQLMRNIQDVVAARGASRQLVRLVAHNDAWMDSLRADHVFPGHPCYAQGEGEEACARVPRLSGALPALRRLKSHIDSHHHSPPDTPTATRELQLWSPVSAAQHTRAGRRRNP